MFFKDKLTHGQTIPSESIVNNIWNGFSYRFIFF